jgi:hypothetical protein
VVVHIIEHTNVSGAISDALVQSQIDILNQDFLVITGSLGANGINAKIQFVLESTAPTGESTTGITRSTNSTWFDDSGSYWDSLAWLLTESTTQFYDHVDLPTCLINQPPYFLQYHFC